MADAPAPFCIFLTHKTELGAPLKVVSRRCQATEKKERAILFSAEKDARNWLDFRKARARFLRTHRAIVMEL